jgi:hypothetical protein
LWQYLQLELVPRVLLKFESALDAAVVVDAAAELVQDVHKAAAAADAADAVAVEARLAAADNSWQVDGVAVAEHWADTAAAAAAAADIAVGVAVGVERNLDSILLAGPEEEESQPCLIESIKSI